MSTLLLADGVLESVTAICVPDSDDDSDIGGNTVIEDDFDVSGDEGVLPLLSFLGELLLLASPEFDSERVDAHFGVTRFCGARCCCCCC